MSGSRLWILFALGSAFFAGLTAFLGKLGVADIASNLATLIRVVVIFVVIAALVASRGEWQPLGTIATRTWIFLVLSGIATGLSWLCYYRALQLGPVSKVAPVDKLGIVVAIALGLAFAGESLTWPAALGAALIVAGSIVMIVF